MEKKSIKKSVYSLSGEKVKELELDPRVFGMKIEESLVHQALVAQMAGKRAVLAHTKDRSEVSGGGIKPWRQKGTGRARHGSTRSPLWVHGGVTFGPTKERNFSQKINRKMKRKALLMCLSDKAESDLLVILDQLNIEGGKTKSFAEILKNLTEKKVVGFKEKRKKEAGKEGETRKEKKFDIKNFRLSILVAIPESNQNIFRSIKNIEGIKAVTADSLNVLDLLEYEKLIMPEESLKVISKTYLAKEKKEK